MPLRAVAEQAKVVLPVAAAFVAADWQFRFVVAPLVLLIALLGASLAEAVTAYRCCNEGDDFDARAKAWEKVSSVAVVFAAACLDAGFYVLGRLAAPVFPLLSDFNIPVVSITWTLFIIYAEAKEARKNYGKMRGRGFSPPFPGGVVEFIETLKRADEVPAERRRRRTDRIIADAERAVGETETGGEP